MIRVLQDWAEIGRCYMGLGRDGLPLHETVQKNWDHYLLRELAANLDHSSRIVDLGCGGGYTLRFLSTLGFTDLTGMDFVISLTARAKLWRRMARNRTLKKPYLLSAGDIVATGLPGESYDMVVSISTIEHGVDAASFLSETQRLLKPGGVAFITTDYWSDKIDTSGKGAFGLPWRIMCQEEIDGFLRCAESNGLEPIGDGDIPPCCERTVSWNGREFTFIALALQKRAIP